MRVNSNKYLFKNNHIEIITVHDQHILIDYDDFERCKKVSWCVDNRGYANGRNNQIGTVRLHRYILSVPKDKQVDHINRNKLDNRKSNLRIVTNQQNQFNRSVGKNNTSGVIGVHFNKTCKKWCCQISVNGKIAHSELFDNVESAIAKRKSLEDKYFNLKEI